MDCGGQWKREEKGERQGNSKPQKWRKVQEVHLREEEPSEEMRTQSTDEQDAKSGLEEVRTAEEVQVSSEGEMRDAGRTRPAVKAQGKGLEEKKKTDAKEDRAAKEEERAQVAPNMEAGASHLQATSDLGEKGKEVV